jgi:hypothetical protein
MMRFVLLCLSPNGSHACAVEEPFFPADLAFAPVVVVGTVAEYQRDQQGFVGTLQVQVAEVMKGDAPAALTLEWPATLSEWPPERWDRETDVILAARPPEGDVGWQLAMETCGRVWLLPDTPENQAIVGDAIRVQP